MPGLGVSVTRDYGLALKRWDEAGSEAPRLGDNKENNPDNAEAIKKIAKEGRRKLNELQKTVKSVDYSSSRYIGDSIRRKCFNEYFVTD